MIVQCQGCNGVSYSTISSDSESYDPETGEFDTQTQQFPLVNIEHTRISLPWSTPKDIKLVYEETSKALSIGLVSLAGIGMRLIIELICKSFDTTGKNLEEKIDSLRDKNIISSAVADTIHGIRFVGNKVAHENKLKAHELDTAWQTINIVLSYVYGTIDNQETLLTPERKKVLEESRSKRMIKDIIDDIPF